MEAGGESLLGVLLVHGQAADRELSHTFGEQPHPTWPGRSREAGEKWCQVGFRADIERAVAPQHVAQPGRDISRCRQWLDVAGCDQPRVRIGAAVARTGPGIEHLDRGTAPSEL